MQSGSYWAFREAGAFGEQEPDEPEPAKPLHCDNCGRFVSARNPVVTKYPEEPDSFDPYYGPCPGRPATEVIEFKCICGGTHREEYDL